MLDQYTQQGYIIQIRNVSYYKIVLQETHERTYILTLRKEKRLTSILTKRKGGNGE
jgi:hypothetical protein